MCNTGLKLNMGQNKGKLCWLGGMAESWNRPGDRRGQNKDKDDGITLNFKNNSKLYVCILYMDYG